MHKEKFVQSIFHDEAATAQIYSACLALPVSILPAITFPRDVLFGNSEVTGLLPFYQENGVLHTACCTREEKDEE